MPGFNRISAFMQKHKGWVLSIFGIAGMGANMMWGAELAVFLDIPAVRYIIGSASLAIFGAGIIYLIIDWFRFKPATNPHVGVLGIYYKKLRAYKKNDGETLYEFARGQYLSRSGLNGGIKFLIVKLDIINMSTIENRLIGCEARITHPKNLNTRIVSLKDAYIDDRDLGFYFAFPHDNIIDFHLPHILKPGKTYTEFLCLELEDDFRLTGEGKIEVRIKDRLGEESKTKFKFSIKEGNAFMID